MSSLRKSPFNSNGTEGMLDVILGCTLIFLLLTALVKIEAGQGREVTLPEMDLSATKSDGKAGADQSKRTVLSLKWIDGAKQVWIDNEPVPDDQLFARLQALGSASVVALRRDRDLPCYVEDDVINQCRKAGISRIAIMLKEE